MTPELAALKAGLMQNELLPRLRRCGLAWRESPISAVEFHVLCELRHGGPLVEGVSHRDFREMLGLWFGERGGLGV